MMQRASRISRLTNNMNKSNLGAELNQTQNNISQIRETTIIT